MATCSGLAAFQKPAAPDSGVTSTPPGAATNVTVGGPEDTTRGFVTCVRRLGPTVGRRFNHSNEVITSLYHQT